MGHRAMSFKIMI